MIKLTQLDLNMEPHLSIDRHLSSKINYKVCKRKKHYLMLRLDEVPEHCNLINRTIKHIDLKYAPIEYVNEYETHLYWHKYKTKLSDSISLVFPLPLSMYVNNEKKVNFVTYPEDFVGTRKYASIVSLKITKKNNTYELKDPSIKKRTTINGLSSLERVDFSTENLDSLKKLLFSETPNTAKLAFKLMKAF